MESSDKPWEVLKGGFGAPLVVIRTCLHSTRSISLQRAFVLALTSINESDGKTRYGLVYYQSLLR